MYQHSRSASIRFLLERWTNNLQYYRKGPTCFCKVAYSDEIPFSVIERHNEESFEKRDYYNKAVEREALILFEVGYEEPFCTTIAALDIMRSFQNGSG